MTKVKVTSQTKHNLREAKLIYINGDEPGYSRKKCGRGFAYYSPDGALIKNRQLKKRFVNLAIPPAWNEVWICMHENGHIQSTGRDEKQRKQYIYHPLWRDIRDKSKFDNLLNFGYKLENIRQQVRNDMQLSRLTKEKLTATIVFLLDKSLIRVGNDYYAKLNNSFGLTTLREKHLDIRGDEIEFSFSGKSGITHTISLRDDRLAKILHQCEEIPGYRIFECYEDGEKISITSELVNDYLKSIANNNVSAKDFRTWGASVEALKLCYLDLKHASSESLDNDKTIDKKINTIIESVADTLGNTPSICKNSYIYPKILEAFQSNELFNHVKSVRAGKWLSRYERALLSLIQA